MSRGNKGIWPFVLTLVLLRSSYLSTNLIDTQTYDEPLDWHTISIIVMIMRSVIKDGHHDFMVKKAPFSHAYFSKCIPSMIMMIFLLIAVRLETGGHGFNPCRGRQHSFGEIDREIFSTVILSLPLIQEGQLSVSGKRMCTILVNRLED